MEQYWEQNGHAPHPVKYESEAAVSGFPYCTESSLNFSTSGTAYSEDDAEYPSGRRNKTSRQDPLSHRIIEKRRRDRMNSCLADLSRLIPPQYQRKGRGRIEKTEIIEMAIRHLKHLQNECVHKEIEYKLGYSDCMKEAAKFLYESHMEDCCYRLIAHLQEHCDEVMKNECFKNRCNVETISASSGSPAQNTNYHHNTSVPISQLRDMLTSDIEHSNDNNDIKDLSFRNHHNQNQTGVITSTAPSSIHHDSSNHDFDSSRDVSHHENDLSSPPPSSHLHLLSTNHSNTLNTVDKIALKSIRLRNFSESSHDIEHNNNNYKYKNHIKERFNHDVTHLHDESASDHSIPQPPPSSSSSSSASTTTATNIVNNNNNNNNNQNDHKLTDNLIIKQQPQQRNDDDDETADHIITIKKRKLDKIDNNINLNSDITSAINDIKIELNSTAIKIPNLTTNNNVGRHFPVPIFALHGQGTYYVPLNIDYESLLPYLNGIDLLDKNFCPIPMLHPVSINVNFSIPSTPANVAANAAAAAASSQSFVGITRPIGLPTAAILPRSKLEKNTNGW